MRKNLAEINTIIYNSRYIENCQVRNVEILKYVIFDVDGVLIDSEGVITKAASLALAERGIKAGMEDFLPYIGAGEEKFITEIAKRDGKEEFTDEMLEHMFVLYEEVVDSELKVFPSTLKTIDALYAQGVTLAIASSATRRKLTASLRAAGIDGKKFAVILSGDDVSAKKPSPEIYLKTAEKLGAPPQECLVIEDALNGVRAAKGAGMKCAAVTTSFSREELAEVNPDIIVDDIWEIMQN